MYYRNKTYVAFDADNDIDYYYIMLAWRKRYCTIFNFHNAHELNNLRSTSSEVTIKRKLRERLNNTKSFILLVGDSTMYHYKFVRWEIEVALKLGIPIICAYLNKRKQVDLKLCPPILRNHLALHITFGMHNINKALSLWTAENVAMLRSKNHIGPQFFRNRIPGLLGYCL